MKTIQGIIVDREISMVSVNERVEQLRAEMASRGIDIYYVPNEDDHLSEEYTADYFKCKSFISGFSGEAGCAVVTKDWAGLWTDGRYFTQAEGELKGTCVELMRMGQAGVPTAMDFLVANTPENGTLGFDGRVVAASSVLRLQRALKEKHAAVRMDEDLAGIVWGKERPAMPEEKLYVLPKKYTGEDAAERIVRVRAAMAEKGADVLIITRLEDPCWMLNIRGDDIACTPVSYAFAMVTKKTVSYYIDPKKLNPEVSAHLKKAGVTVKKYDALEKDLKKLSNKTIWADLRSLNAYLYEQIGTDNRILNLPSPILQFRACKNRTEIRNLRNAHLKDGVAMVKFLYWLKTNIGTIDMTEISAENKLYSLREEQEGYIEPSFHTISAYKGNAAMMHYSATEASNAVLKPEGFLLVDSGGTYCDGTTDITRTIALGKLTDEEKMYFTKVLRANLRLARAKFLYGTTGNNLDILARGVLWDLDIDYQCGTGHGVGHVLGVHEGPHGIRWGMPAGRPNAVLEPGMIVTDEPGVYLPHKLGIRTENELLVTKGKKNFYGQFLHFEVVTYCPIDLDAVLPEYLSDEDIEQLNAYHAMVYEKLSPFLKGKEKSWLKQATGKIKK